MPITANGKTVLVTGGAGYIGSHCVVTLQEAGYEVIGLDNFANSVNGLKDDSVALKRVEEITGKKIPFYKCDLLDLDAIEAIFKAVSVFANIWQSVLSQFTRNCDSMFVFGQALITTAISSFKRCNRPQLAVLYECIGDKFYENKCRFKRLI